MYAHPRRQDRYRGKHMRAILLAAIAIFLGGCNSSRLDVEITTLEIPGISRSITTGLQVTNSGQTPIKINGVVFNGRQDCIDKTRHVLKSGDQLSISLPCPGAKILNVSFLVEQDGAESESKFN